MSKSPLYIAADEEVTSILERLKTHKEKELTLQVPPQAKLFQSPIHLKLLYNEAIALNKIVTIASTNQVGLTLAANTGFPTELLTEKEMPKEKGTKRGLKVKESIDSSTFMMPSPGKRIINLFFLISALVFVIIAYFVLPTVTIELKPEVKIERPIERVTLADSTRNSAEIAISSTPMIGSLPIDTEIELTKTYSTSGVASKGNNAQGQLTIFNQGDQAQLLIARTRFRSPDGYIFRIPNAVSVPAKSSTKTLVVADPLDDKAQVIGAKGNLPAKTRFTLPALKGTYKDLIYGENEQAFTGGVTEAIKAVTAEDISKASQDIVSEVNNLALQKLQERVDQENKSKGSSLILVKDPKVVKIQVQKTEVKDGVKPNDLRDTFQVYTKVKVNTVTFERKDMMKILDRKLSSLLNPDLRIAAVDYDALELQFVEQDIRNQKEKFNVTVPYRLEYILKPDYLDRIKNQIIGLSLVDSETYLNRLETIAESKISAWPFWVKSIPGLKSNITMKVQTATL
ncbi:MAG: hypothetical protein HY817_04440 [Candidatus Abawacabacteria bacterium]|nr:hypothetical protein [Candidatus Abawacabacteria bacterium]